MGEFHSRNIERNGIEFFGLAVDLGIGNKKEFRAGVNESLNQPWASDSINFRVFAGNPPHRKFSVRVDKCRENLFFSRHYMIFKLSLRTSLLIEFASPEYTKESLIRPTLAHLLELPPIY